MSINCLNLVIKEAIDYVNSTCRTKKGAVYAANILLGLRTWSGSDLQGKARRYSRCYKDRRADALDGLEYAGGCLIKIAPSGKYAAAVYIGQDDFGDAIYQTYYGVALTQSDTYCKLIET